MRVKNIPGIMLTLSLSLLFAQDASFSLDPTDIFDDSVEIRYVQQPPEDVPFPWDDTLQRFVIDGAVYDYPDTFTSIYSIEAFDERMVLIGTNSEQARNGVFIFDHESKSLALYEDLCRDEGLLSPQRILEELWTVNTDDSGESYLCNRISGERSEPLPAERNWIFDTGIGDRPLTLVSPDRRYVAFLGAIGRQQNAFDLWDVEVYTYDINAGAITSLGVMEAGPYLYFDRWIGERIALETGDTTTIGSVGVYVAEAGRENSVQFALSMNNGSPSFLSNPPRYVVGFDAPHSPAPCGRVTYYVETSETIPLNLGGLCRPDYGDVDAVGYYRDVPQGQSFECCYPMIADVAEVPLVRHDARTGDRKELYRGEIEHIYWVSPDDRYAILLLDHNGQIDFFPYLGYLTPYDNRPVAAPFVVLVDLETQQFLAGTPVDLLFGAVIVDDWAVNHSITPLPDGTFVMIYCRYPEVACARAGNTANRITVTESGVEETPLIDDPIMLTPDRSGLFIWSQPVPRGELPPTRQGVNIYDLSSGEIQPFVKEMDIEESQLSLEVISSEAVLVTVSIWSEAAQDLLRESFAVYFEPDGSRYVKIMLPPEPAIGQYVCVLTTETGVNLRMGPSGNLERFGTAERGERLVAVAQAVSDYDGLTWWRLDSGGWVRSDFVTETMACTLTPSTNSTQSVSPEGGETGSGEMEGEENLITCALSVLTGAYVRSGPSRDFDSIGSIAANQNLNADGQYANREDHFIWWRTTDGGWVREDLVAEGENCDALPVIESP